MKKVNFQETVDRMVQENPQYHPQAYVFIREALDYTIKMLEKPISGPNRHVSGGELLEGIRQYALQEFGPITMTVLNRWGIEQCEDFGRLVFLMVKHGILGKTDQDTLEDFSGGYGFDTAFRQPFRPAPRAKAPRTGNTTPAS